MTSFCRKATLAVLGALMLVVPARGDGVTPTSPRESVSQSSTTGSPDGPAEALRQQIVKTAPTVAIFAIAALVPAAVLMVTAFVRISIVLTLLRQALGSPQIPSNQVLSALALLLTALVMEPVARDVYHRGIEPFANGRLGPQAAWEAGTGPIKAFMIEQIRRTRHEDYLWQLYDRTEPDAPGRVEPTEYEQFPLRIVAPAFLLSEITTALVIGFAIYLPFLVVDLVVSAVLAAMGLFMLPPALVALPLKLILFVLADGWMLLTAKLLESFGPA
jgi:flagellar biosynthetic protein FliP